MEDIRPTAKWANRMLRPLTSIYRRLEKYQETPSTIVYPKRERRESGGESKRQVATTTGEEGFCSDGEPDDPAWVPGNPVKRRIRRKYSNRGEAGRGGRKRSRLSLRSPELQRTLPGAIEIATPLITGKAGRFLDRSSARKQLFRTTPAVPTGTGVSDGRRAGRMKDSFPAYRGSWKEALDLSGDTGLRDIAHLLDRIFIKFLNNTRKPVVTKSRGARSLMSMVVRCLPEFIAEEQREQDEEEGNADVDMCDAYFTELEAHYAPHGNGWPPLREAVRAQGIYLVSEMVSRKWVTNLVACRLLEECTSHQEYDAFESILSTLLSTIDTYDYPAAFDSSRTSVQCDDPVYILGSYYSKFPQRRPFVFEELGKLLLRGVVPPEWTVTNLWKRCVDGAIRSLSAEDDSSTVATRLIEAVVLSAGNIDNPAVNRSKSQIRSARAKETRNNATGLPQDQSPCPIPIQDALSNLTLSLMTALSGMHIARSHTGEDKPVSMRLRNLVSHLAFTVQREIELRPIPEGDVPTYQSLRRGCVLLGDCLLQCGREAQPNSTGQNIESFFSSLATRPEVIKELAAFARQVFRCCEHAHRRDQTRTSHEIRSKVSQLAELSETRGLSTFLGKVASETAMVFAETTGDPDDHVWAVEIQEIVTTQREKTVHQARKPQTSSSASLYRWEESIGEWVEKTPVPKDKGMVFDLALRRGPRMSIPSTIACSTGSSSPRSALSETRASSMTLSPPSVPVKRALPERPALRTSKRLRSGPVMYEDQSESPQPTVSTTGPPAEHKPLALNRPRRGVLRELAQARKMLPRVNRTSPLKPRVEVVIVNRSHDTDDEQEQEQEHIPQHTRRRLSKCISLNQDEDKDELHWEDSRTITHTAPMYQYRRRSVIPCSEDNESDDELSFF